MEKEDSIMVLRHSPVSGMPQLLHIHLHCNTNLGEVQASEEWGHSNRAMFFRLSGSSGQRILPVARIPRERVTELLQV